MVHLAFLPFLNLELKSIDDQRCACRGGEEWHSTPYYCGLEEAFSQLQQERWETSREEGALRLRLAERRDA
jgi:hypothetical protein